MTYLHISKQHEIPLDVGTCPTPLCVKCQNINTGKFFLGIVNTILLKLGLGGGLLGYKGQPPSVIQCAPDINTPGRR